MTGPLTAMWRFIGCVRAVGISVADDRVVDALAVVTVKLVAARWRRRRCRSHTNTNGPLDFIFSLNNNINNNKRTCIALQRRKFRGAGARQCARGKREETKPGRRGMSSA